MRVLRIMLRFHALFMLGIIMQIFLITSASETEDLDSSGGAGQTGGESDNRNGGDCGSTSAPGFTLALCVAIFGGIVSPIFCFLGLPYRAPTSIGLPAKEANSLMFKNRSKRRWNWHDNPSTIRLERVRGSPGVLTGNASDAIGDYILTLELTTDGRMEGQVRGSKRYISGTGDRRKNFGHLVELDLQILTHWSPARGPGLYGTYRVLRDNTQDKFELLSSPTTGYQKPTDIAIPRYPHPLRFGAISLCLASFLFSLLGGVTETTYMLWGGGWAPLTLMVLFALPRVSGWSVSIVYVVATGITCYALYMQTYAVGILENADNCGVVGDGGLFSDYCGSEADQGCVVVQYDQGQCDVMGGEAYCVGVGSSSVGDVDALAVFVRCQIYTMLGALLGMCLHWRALSGHIRKPTVKELKERMQQEPEEFERICSEMMGIDVFVTASGLEKVPVKNLAKTSSAVRGVW